MQLQRRSDDDDRAARVVDALAEQVLAEAPLLALDHVGQRLQRALVGAGDGTTAAAVIEQGVDRLLQHALFVAHDDVGSVELEQPLEAVVAIDHPAIEVVQVRGGEAAAVERDQRAQLRRQHRQHRHDHPLGFVTRLEERLDQFQPLGELLQLGLGVGRRDLFAQLQTLGVEVDGLEQLAHRFGAHARVEFVTVLLDGLEIGLVVEQLATLEQGQTRVDNDKGLEVEDAFDVTQGHVEHQADARRQ